MLELSSLGSVHTAFALVGVCLRLRNALALRPTYQGLTAISQLTDCHVPNVTLILATFAVAELQYVYSARRPLDAPGARRLS